MSGQVVSIDADAVEGVAGRWWEFAATELGGAPPVQAVGLGAGARGPAVLQRLRDAALGAGVQAAQQAAALAERTRTAVAQTRKADRWR